MLPGATDPSTAFTALGISLGLGLLVGLQRERAASRLAGIRTFALITVLGTLSAILADRFGGWVFAASLVALAAASAVGNFIADREEPDRTGGITTEIAMILMFAVGALAYIGPASVAVAVGVGVAVLLQAKQRLHGLAAKMGEKDLRVILLFGSLTFIVLPILPDRTYGPLDVLNPHQIWLMVVLVVGMSLAGYIAYKFLGARTGAILGGFLGGLISSTATTVSYARRTKETEGLAPSAALVITVATTVMYARVIGLIAVVAPDQAMNLAPPIGAMLIFSLILSAAVWVASRGNGEKMPEQENPAELRPALVFAVIYAMVLFGVALAKRYLGEGGIYGVAAFSGIADLDAISLSTARLANEGQVAPATAIRAIIIAMSVNMIAKCGIVAWLGSRALLGRIVVVTALTLAAAGAIAVFWPLPSQPAQ